MRSTILVAIAALAWLLPTRVDAGRELLATGRVVVSEAGLPTIDERVDREVLARREGGIGRAVVVLTAGERRYRVRTDRAGWFEIRARRRPAGAARLLVGHPRHYGLEVTLVHGVRHEAARVLVGIVPDPEECLAPPVTGTESDPPPPGGPRGQPGPCTRNSAAPGISLAAAAVLGPRSSTYCSSTPASLGPTFGLPRCAIFSGSLESS